MTIYAFIQQEEIWETTGEMGIGSQNKFNRWSTQGIRYKGILANYMDNFVIPAKTMEELEERMIWFLKIVEKHNLCFKWSKCDFNMEEISILGVIVGKGQIKMEQEKIKVVKEWKTPTKVKDIESFLGFTNFY